MPARAQRRPVRHRAALALGCVLAACTYETNAPKLTGQDVHLTVLHTSDIHSRILPYHFTPNKFDKQNGLVPEVAPYGGAARLATLLKRERARSARVIHVDAGDWFDGAPIFNAFSGLVETRVMSALGVDVAAVGNHEFDKGPINLAKQLGNWAGFPILAANYLFKDPNVAGNNTLGKIIKPYTILDVDGLKVGVIGLGSAGGSSILQGDNSLGVTAVDTEQTIELYADLIRPQVDLLIAVSHLGLDQDENTASSSVKELQSTSSQARGDLDVVFGGHLHIVLNPPSQIPIYANGKPTRRTSVLVHSGAFAKTIGRLDLVVHVNTPDEMRAEYDRDRANALAAGDPVPEARRGYVKAYDYTLIPVTARQPVDNEWCVTPNEDESGQACTPRDPDPLKNAMQGYCRMLGGGARRACDLKSASDCSGQGDECLPCVYCHVPEDAEIQRLIEPYALAMNSSPKFQLTRLFAANTVTGGILRNNPAGGDSQLGNIVATAMRLQPEVQADFAVTNSLGIRTDFSQGPISIEQLFNVFPFENTIEIMYLSGTEIQQMFDFVAAKSATRGCKTQAQISGVAFAMDCGMPPHTPNGGSCDPDLYKDTEDLGQCYQGAATLILVGSQHPCTSNDDCPAQGAEREVCGATLGFCGDATTHLGSRQPCSLDAPQCPRAETCNESGLNVCGKIINPTGDYRVAVNDYMANGGSGFKMLKFNRAKYNTNIGLRDALVDYLQRLDDPNFEGPYSCQGTPSAATCRGAIRCDDARFAKDFYLQMYGTVTPDVSFTYCPGKTRVGDCFGNMICILPHNQAIDGRVRPRF